jgi:hypothetical protein
MEETVPSIREPTEAPTDQQSNLQSKYISALEQKLEAFEKDAKKQGEKSSSVLPSSLSPFAKLNPVTRTIQSRIVFQN